MSNPSEPVAALNGRVIPLSEAGVSVVDDGLVQGATVTERIRTFRQRPFRLAEHLDRLRQSLSMTGVAPTSVVDGLPPLIDDVVRENAKLLAGWQDVAIVLFITPGLNQTLLRSINPAVPTICIHTTPLPAPQWAEQASAGLRLVTSSVRQVPGEIIDPRIKHRSRLHWFLADQQVKQVDPQAQALLLDPQGYATETSTGNLMVFDGQRLLRSRADRVLGGISQRVVANLAEALGIKTAETDLVPADIVAAQEAWLTSTGYCVLPVTNLNGGPVGAGRPGPLYQQVMAAWSELVGVDILRQFQRGADEPHA